MPRPTSARAQDIATVADRAAVSARSVRRFVAGAPLHANTLRRINEALADGPAWMPVERAAALTRKAPAASAA